MKRSLLLVLCFSFIGFGIQTFAVEKELENNEMQDSVENTTEVESLFESAEENATNKEVKKIIVTGSRITRIDTKGANPLVIYSKEDLENSGYSSAGDFLRDTTISHFGVSREEAGSSFSGESFTNIKGEKSLILINGVRVAEDPNAGAVDLNLIPLFAIERVEILKDGASALYGSDAVGGVINFITKKDFSGMEIHGQMAPTIWPLYKGGSRADIATVFGDSSKKGSYIGSLHVRFQDSVENSERKWTNKNISPVGPYGIFNGQTDPNCPKKLITSSGCKFNAADYSTRHPRYGQFYGYLQGNYKWNETILYSQLITSYKNNKWSYAPIRTGQDPVSGKSDLIIPSNHQMSFGQGQEGPLDYRFMEAGQRDTSYNNFIGDLTVGTKGYVSPTWDYDFSVKLAHIIKNNKEEGLLLKKELTEAIVNGKYDPFNTKKRDLSKALYTAKNNNDSTLLFSSLDFSGESGFWDIDLATGFQAYYKSFSLNADKNIDGKKLLSNTGGSNAGERYVLSYYLEGIKYFSEMLEIQLAGRADYYSDFKWTANPKLAFKFKPHSQFLLRGSLGTAFIAPPLSIINEKSATGHPRLFDTLACYNELKAKGGFNKVYEKLTDLSDEKKEKLVKDFLIEQKDVIKRKTLSKEVKTELENLSKSVSDKEYCNGIQYSANSLGNKKLKETKAIVASFGSHWQIAEEHGLTFDLWYIKKSGMPSYGLSKKTLDAELKFGNKYVQNKGVTVNRDDKKPYNPISGINTKMLNLGSTQKSGIDLEWESDLSNVDLFNGSPYFKDQVSYILFSKAEAFPGMGYVDRIGKFGAPRWRNIATLGWKNKKHNISLTTHTVSSFGKESSELENLPMSTRLDLDYQFVISAKTTFKFGWSNLLFSSPPTDEKLNDNKIDNEIFESRGPFFFAGIKYTI